jgi:hypothetical protein
MDDGTSVNGLTVSHETTTTLTVVYFVSNYPELCDESAAIAAAESHSGLSAFHADPDSDGWLVTMERR